MRLLLSADSSLLLLLLPLSLSLSLPLPFDGVTLPLPLFFLPLLPLNAPHLSLSSTFARLISPVRSPLQSAAQPSCEYKMVNESRMVVCDLGNPMVAGTEVRFDTQKQKHTHTHTHRSPRRPCQTSTLRTCHCYSSGLIHTD